MKSNLETLSPLERKLNIVVPAEEVQAAFEQAFKGIQKHAELKGFRKGKAPMVAIRRAYGDRVKQDVLQSIVQSNFASAVDQHQLDPISFPAIEFDEIDESREFSFTAEFEVRPEVKLAQFEGLVVEREKFEPKAEAVDETLEELRNSRPEFTPVLEDRPAQVGDVAIIDFQGNLLTGPLENGAGQNYQLELGSQSFIPGFEEGIVGMKPGATTSLNLSFPEKYHVAELAGKPVTFTVTLKELKKKSLPELNDAFVEQLGGPYKTVADLRKAIQDDTEKRETRRIQEDLKNRLMRALVEKNPVEVPKSLLAEQKKSLIEDMRQRMAQQGMDPNQFEDYKAKWDQDFSETARFMIQSSFLIDTIAREHQLFAKPEDINKKLEEYAQQTGIELERVKSFYDDKDRRSRLSFQITEEKVTEFLLSKAKIKDITRAELEAKSSGKE